MFFEKKRQRGRGESENGNKGRRNKSKQAVEGKTLSLSLSLFSALTLAAGCDTSISRRMALPSLVSTMPGFGFEVVSFFWGGGYGLRQEEGRVKRTTAENSIASGPSLSRLFLHLQSLRLTSRRVQEHLEHRARAQSGADDVGDGLF